MAQRLVLVGTTQPAALALALALDREGPAVELLGLGLEEPPLLGPRFEFVPLAAGGPPALARIGSADAVVAFPALTVAGTPRPDAGTVVELARWAVRAAERWSARSLLLWSAAEAVGARPDNPVPLVEGCPARPAPDSLGATLEQAERIVLAASSDRLHAAVLRAAPVWQPPWRTDLARRYAAARMPRARAGAAGPPVQALHPDDATAALVHAVGAGLDGLYHVAPDDWVSLRAALQALRRAGHPRPAAGRARFHVRDAWPGPRGPAGGLPLGSCVLANGALRATGWAPRHGTLAALNASRHDAHPRPGAQSVVRWARIATAAAVGGTLLVVARERQRSRRR